MTSILVIDDETIIRNGIKAILEKQEDFFVAGTAEDGLQALQAIEKLHPDIVLTDINMPNMDGLEMIERLREVDEDIMVLMLTGYDDFSYAQRALRAGAEDYILKPIGQNQLIEVMKKAAHKVEQAKELRNQTRLLENMVGSKVLKESRGTDNVGEIMLHIEEHWNNPDLTMDMIASEMFMNANYLRQLFKARHHMSFVTFIRQLRLENAATLLATTEMQIKRISQEVGYLDSAYFSVSFRDVYGVSPSEYREQHGVNTDETQKNI